MATPTYAETEAMAVRMKAALREVDRSNNEVFDAAHAAIAALERLEQAAFTARTGILRG